MIAWATEALIASSLLMLVVLLVRAPVRRLVGPQIAYALWSLPALRLLLPPLPADWREQAAMPISRASEAVTVLVLPATAPAPVAVAAVEAAPVAAALPWGMIVAIAWALGASAFFVWHFLRHRHFCRNLLAQARLVDEIDGVRVVETPAAAGPLAFGLRLAGLGRRFVAFPDDFADRYDADERELALAHELGHHARGDLFANWAALAVLALHWFNPLAWRAFRAFRADQELANDARVLAGRSRADRHIYACAIVKAAHGGAIAATCHLHTITDLKGRLRMLTIARVSRTRLAAGATAVVTLVGTGLLVTASGTQAAAAITAQVENATGVRLVAPPAPPAPVTRTVRTPQHVVIVKDGKTVTYDGDAAARYIAAHPVPLAPVPPVPPLPAAAAIAPAAPPPPPGVVVTGESGQLIVSNGDCHPDQGPSVVSQDRDGKRAMIVCRNRVRAMADTAARVVVDADASVAVAERQAAYAERQADYAERQARMSNRAGLAQATASIQLARRSIEANRNLTADQRRDALAGLDDAMAEVRDAMQD
ncbi:M56 family metallopeptidase [Sphingomonas sp. KR1UV-12]|uniref:M56 family metallopeptidase n=1 Tax=Sphingomonas aurea TaxID=3063994 RepID=A0ABT9EN97_9SPHN|nr:M56 family metallopeptidase [Sphingomonas sp. KR1UV-12]MDP1028118.1 M56 family metallopeptidase [Sphingomonas sp. KR1UV-12]